MIKGNYLLISISLLSLFSCGSKNTTQQSAQAKLSPIDSLSQLLAVDRDNTNLLYQRAKLYVEKGDYTAAKIDISKAILRDTTKADYYPLLADIYMGLRQPVGAKAALEKCVEVAPNHVEGLNKLAEFNLFLKNYQETIRLADRALRVDIHNPKSYFIKGFAFMESGDTNKAINSMQTAVEQNPDYYEAFLQLGILFSAKKSKLAVNYFSNASQLQPNNIEPYYNLGMFYQNAGQIDKAIETYRLLLKLDNKDADTHYNLGYIDFMYKKAYDSAILNFTQALANDKKMAKAAYMRGLCYEALKRNDKAKAEYAFALKIDSSFALAAKANLRLLGLK
ncbi:MAG: tetratricopeptide repeat protein [Bacteroidia bacterium]|nr:tetratricopeptide repeat protein [Bacteroidia bacterium]